jgi:hypothetical protein
MVDFRWTNRVLRLSNGELYLPDAYGRMAKQVFSASSKGLTLGNYAITQSFAVQCTAHINGWHRRTMGGGGGPSQLAIWLLGSLPALCAPTLPELKFNLTPPFHELSFPAVLR